MSPARHRSETASPRPRVGISACVLGENVRYNGGNTRMDWITDELAPHVDWVPVCPEVAMGLGTPRDAHRLHRPDAAAGLRLVASRSQEDRTELARATVERIVDALPAQLDGFI